jgi:hypothetical protein
MLNSGIILAIFCMANKNLYEKIVFHTYTTCTIVILMQ